MSLEEAQGRQAMRKPIVNDDISEFEQKVTVEETTVTDNADIETENDISEKKMIDMLLSLMIRLSLSLTTMNL